MDARDADERVSAHQPLDPALVLGLELVVELLADPLAHLRRQRLRVEARREPLDERQQQHRVAQVGLDRLGDPRVLDLDDDLVAVEGRRAVDLADRGGGERALVEVGEHLLERPAELLAHAASRGGERDRRDVVAERGELALQLVLLLLGKAVELDHRDHLADLHRRAAHLAELLDELVHERRRPLVLGGRGPLGRADPVGGPHAGPPQRPGRSPGRRPAPSARRGRSAACLPRAADRRLERPSPNEASEARPATIRVDVNIFISPDIEGIAGIVDWQQVRGPGSEYEIARQLLTDEVNAAIDGAGPGGRSSRARQRRPLDDAEHRT